MPSLEAMGVEDWDVQVLRRLVPLDRPIAVQANAATWAFSGLARLTPAFRTPVIDVLRAGTAHERETLFASLAYDDESAPQYIWVPIGERLPAAGELRRWSREDWRRPDQLVPDPVERVIARFAGWLHIAVGGDALPATLALLDGIAATWGFTTCSAPAEWAWSLG
jgi:hypothetical protein